MCGIAGFIGAPIDDGGTVLRGMTTSLAHRGPDAENIHLEHFAFGELQIGLGHRRLSIIDLAGGQQPMGSETGQFQIVFNGEIYNHRALRAELQALGHRFRTASDTEVLLRAYEAFGADCVHHLRGMFAFAIWDRVAETLFIARDRFGEKPLVYTQMGDTLVFASELRALQCWPGFHARLNVDVLPHYLQYRYVPGPHTWLAGVHKLGPGCHLTWTKRGMHEHRYYRPQDARSCGQSTDDATARRAFGDKLDETVALMMDSDVPYGAFLSGGIDSSAIVALMARHSSAPVRTFSIGFAEAGYSELGHAAAVARSVGADHREILVSGTDILDALPQAVAFRDGPIAEPADVPMYLLARAARQSVKMVLTGEGSDEALGGYPKHVYERFGAPYRALPRAVRHGLVEPLARSLPYSARRVKTAMAALAVESFEERMPRWFGALSSEEVSALCGSAPQRLTNGARYPFESDPKASALRRMLFFDQTSWLPDNLLERGDRLTMAASIEARMPFMDYQLVEMAASLSDRQRIRGMTTKRMLREAIASVLPPEIVRRPKVGFTMPIGLWLRTPLRDMLNEHLLGEASLTRRLMDARVVQRYLEEHQKGQRNHEKLLWMLLNLELWARQMRLSA